MASDPSDIWSPYQGTTIFMYTFSPTRQSYTPEIFDDEHSNDSSLHEVHATLSNFDKEFNDTEQALTEWLGSYMSGRPTNSTGRRIFASSYSGTYTGSPSFASLPTFSSHSPFLQIIDPQARLRSNGRISIAASASSFLRLANPTPDGLRYDWKGIVIIFFLFSTRFEHVF